MQKYNKSNNKKQARPWVRELKKFENIHLGKSGMLLIPAPSVLNRWPDSRPTIPEYDNCIKATVNRMIYLNPVIAHDCDYYFFGSWFNRDLEYQAKILKFIKEKNLHQHMKMVGHILILTEEIARRSNVINLV